MALLKTSFKGAICFFRWFNNLRLIYWLV